MTSNPQTVARLGLAHLDHLNMTVRDLAESVDWYRRVLDFEQVEEGVSGQTGASWAILRSGDAMLCLYEHPDLAFEAKATRAHHGLGHFAVRITDRAAWEARMKREGVAVGYGGVVTWPHSASWYVTDPTGYEIEVVAWTADVISF